MTAKRWSLVAGSAGLVGGLALGVTGLASAVSPSPSPGTSGSGSGLGSTSDERPLDHAKGERGLGRAGGLVSAVTSSSLTVRTPDGTKTIALNNATTYANGRASATRSIIKVGGLVFVKLVDPQAAAPVAAAVTVLPAHLGGFITKVDGGTVTIVDESGFTRTLTTTSATTYEKDGAKATSSILAVGALVRALGTVDADGTTLDAVTISMGRPTRGPEGFGGPGFGGHGRGQRPGPPPAAGVPG
jgi:hypothetical protein